MTVLFTETFLTHLIPRVFKLTLITFRRLINLEEHIRKLQELQTGVEECTKTIQLQQTKLQFLESKLDDLENRSRRCNLIFYGIEDTEERETYESAEQRVLDLCKSVLSVDDVHIERAHRLGIFRPGNCRPIIVNFATYKGKECVLTNAKKLKGSPISISEDFSEPIRMKRKQLWEYAKKVRKDTDKVNLRYDALYINKTKYIYDEPSGEVLRAT